jgi:hypothetical protein
MKYIILCLVFLVGCNTVTTIEQVNTHDYKIVGKLDKIEYDKIITIVKSHPNEPVNFYVYSNGGTSRDLFEAMDSMYYHGNVHWFSTRCDSACAVMALSTKHAEGKFRLHSFYRRDRHQIYAAPEFNKQVLDHLQTYGYDTEKINYMFYSVEELWTITIHDGVIEK